MPARQPSASLLAHEPASARIASAVKLHGRVLQQTAVIVGLVLAAYFPSIQGKFLLDDDLLLTDNAAIKAPHGLDRFWSLYQLIDYTPLTNTTLWVEWRLWAMNPTGYHVTNLLLHIVATLLLWRILRRLSVPGAL